MIKVIDKIANLILILVIIALGSYVVLSHLNQLLIYNVKTGSMEDNIHVGDYILIVKKDDYQVGDVVTFRKSGGFITHRIINKKGDIITTKGDANNIEDDNIEKKNIIGKVIISGGILNFIIKYKYALVSLLLSLYLFSWYFNKKDEMIGEDEEISEIEIDEIKDEETEDLENEEKKQLIEENDVKEETEVSNNKEKTEEVEIEQTTNNTKKGVKSKKVKK